MKVHFCKNIHKMFQGPPSPWFRSSQSKMGFLKKDTHNFKNYFYLGFLWIPKVPILKEVNFGKMQLCRVEHFYNIFVLTFGRDCWIQ